jgi:flagellar motor switch/type III secretory pathway protein FliN
MENLLSREELAALLGNAGSEGRSELPQAEADCLTLVGNAAARALRTFLDVPSEVTAGDFYVTKWDKFPSAAGLPIGASLLLVEARLLDIGAPAFMVATTLTAYRLEEMASLAIGACGGEGAFVGWRRTTEYILADVCLALGPANQAAALLPRTLPPRQWKAVARPQAVTDQDATVPMFVIPLTLQDSTPSTVFFLIPSATLSLLVGSEAVAEKANGPHSQAVVLDAPRGQPGYSLVDEVPLSIAAVLVIGRLPVKAVAQWQVGSLVPLEIAAGLLAELQANGHPLARGKIVNRPEHGLAIEITSLQDFRKPLS